MRSQGRYEVRARAIVNAGGPFVADVLNSKLGLNTNKNVRLVKGSHIVVPKLFDGDQAFILQNKDKRIVFAIPYQGKFTLVGTTDIPVEAVPDKKVEISGDEIRYLCDAINHFFKREIEPGDVVWTYSGVRPLFDDGSSNASAVTRDYVFELDAPNDSAPVLSIFGGKITTFRKLAEHALEDLKRFFPAMKPSWTETAKLPGGDMPDADFDRFLATVKVALSLPRSRPRLSAVARLWHPHHEPHRHRDVHGRSRRGFRRWADGRGSGLSGPTTNGRAAPRISSGGARSSACMYRADAPARIDAYLATRSRGRFAAQSQAR